MVTANSELEKASSLRSINLRRLMTGWQGHAQVVKILHNHHLHILCLRLLRGRRSAFDHGLAFKILLSIANCLLTHVQLVDIPHLYKISRIGSSYISSAGNFQDIVDLAAAT